MQRSIRDAADARKGQIRPATIDDPAILDEITGVMTERGVAKG